MIDLYKKPKFKPLFVGSSTTVDADDNDNDGDDQPIVYDVCTSNPCKHGGTCTVTDGGNDYMCECSGDFSGHNCQILYGGKKNFPCTFELLYYLTYERIFQPYAVDIPNFD